MRRIALVLALALVLAPGLMQGSANSFARVVTLSAGAVTVTLTGYAQPPVCVATKVGATVNALNISAVSAGSVTVKSALGTDTSSVNLVCIANPN